MYNSVVKYLDNLNCGDIAIETETTKVTYGEYRSLARRIGTFISINLNMKNSPIAVYASKDERALITYMGILYSGNYYCPIPYNSPEERAKQMLDILESPYIITTDEDKEKVLEWGGEKHRVLLYEEVIDNPEDDKKIEKILDKVIDCDPAYLLFTSGTTGIPKGVVIPHRAIIDRIEWMADKFGLDQGNVLANQAPFHFDASMPDIYLNLIAKSKLVIPPERLFVFSFELLRFLKERNVNTLIWVPSALINLTQRNIIQKCKLDRLKLVIFCGEVMPNKYLNIIRTAYKDAIFVNMYGPTEAAYACTYKIVEGSYSDQEMLPIGIPCGNTDVFLLDSENNMITESNVEGEICIRGSSLALGYYHDLNYISFSDNLFSQYFCNHIYRTGDMGYWNLQNDMMYAGRKDSQIKHMGYRIELGEIEAAVQSIEAVKYACVLYDDEKSEIVLLYESDNPDCDKKFIVHGIHKLLPQYMYPHRYIKLQKMLFNLNGKIDRARLREIMEED